MSLTRPSGARQYQPDPDCKHSKEPFDAAFACIVERTDIGPGPKMLYGKLVTMHRVGAAWTQDELAERLGTCRQNVWRWTRQLVDAGLLIVARLGQGRPNAYTLLGVPVADLDGAAKRGRPGAGHQDGREPGQDRRASFKTKNDERKQDYTGDYARRRYAPRPPGGYLESRRG